MTSLAEIANNMGVIANNETMIRVRTATNNLGKKQIDKKGHVTHSSSMGQKQKSTPNRVERTVQHRSDTCKHIPICMSNLYMQMGG